MTDPREPLSEEPRNAYEAALLERVADVERDNARLRRLSIASIVLVAVLAGLAVAIMVVSARYGLPGTTADIVAARQLVIRDAQGLPRGLWGVDDSGAVRLILQDQGGQPRIRLSLLGDGAAGVTLIDSAGHNRAVLALLPDQAVTMALADGTGKTRSVFGLSPDGNSNLLFADRTGVPRASLGVDSRGIGNFAVSDRGRPVMDESPDAPADTTAAEPGE
ncbi:MAG TPA: hypothetical protein VF037_07650 [Gemmatimonadales bacterium]